MTDGVLRVGNMDLKGNYTLNPIFSTVHVMMELGWSHFIHTGDFILLLRLTVG